MLGCGFGASLPIPRDADWFNVCSASALYGGSDGAHVGVRSRYAGLLCSCVAVVVVVT